MTEYEGEPIRGLPGYLPPGERILWQGEPRWSALSQRVFHTRKVALYLVVLIVLGAAQRSVSGEPAIDVAGSVLWQCVLGASSVGILALLAWRCACTTVYTITNHRIVMRFGVALPMMVNIPWDCIESAVFRSFSDGNGDIVLIPTAKSRISYWTIWPHVRPWRFRPVQPSLRGIDDAARVAALIGTAVGEQPVVACGSNARHDWIPTTAATA